MEMVLTPRDQPRPTTLVVIDSGMYLGNGIDALSSRPKTEIGLFFFGGGAANETRGTQSKDYNYIQHQRCSRLERFSIREKKYSKNALCY
jgi:hypothetical protein